MMRYKSSGAVKRIVDVKERNNEFYVNRGCKLKVCRFIENGLQSNFKHSDEFGHDETIVD